ncbi:MAG: hypothetical protein ACREQV_00660, partial [Candidatus Binatia bacterium]
LPADGGAPPPAPPDQPGGTADRITGGIVAVLAGIAVVGLAAAAVIGIWIFLTTILLALLIALLTLAARQALIIILTILSSIAFVAWVMPNTEQYFKKWWGMFLSALMMYPLIMILFAGSHVASTIFTADGFGGSTAENAVLKVLGLVIAVIPLFAMPFMFKVAGTSLNKIGKLARSGANGYTKQFGDNRLGQWAKQKKDNRMAAWAGSKQPGPTGKFRRYVGGRKLARDNKYAKQDAFAKRAQQTALAQRTAMDDRYALASAGVAGEQGAGLVRAQAVQQQEKEEQEYRDAAKFNWKEKYPKDMPSLADELVNGARGFSVGPNGERVNVRKLSNTEIQG